MFEPPWTPAAGLATALREHGHAVLHPNDLGAALGRCGRRAGALQPAGIRSRPTGFTRDGGPIASASMAA